MAKVRITWKDRKLAEDGVKIYRGTSPIDPQALPSPLASVAVDRGVYEDKTANAGTTYHYHVAPFDSAEVGAGAAANTVVTEEVPRVLYVTQQYTLATLGTTLSLDVPDCKAGDLLVLFGLRRSAFTSTPAGWTMGPVPANSPNAAAQWTFAMWKISNGTEAGTTITLQQTDSTRLSASIAVIRHDSKAISVTSLGTARFTGAPGNNALSFTNTNKPALVMSICSWSYQVTGTSECFIENYPTRMIPMCRPTRWWITEPRALQMRYMAWFIECAANEAYNSGTGWSWTVSDTNDSRSDIYLAITV